MTGGIGPQLVVDRGATVPDAVAMRVLESGVWVEYGWVDVVRTVARVADVLRRGGIEPGAEVAVVCGSRAEWALCVWAINGLGATAVAITPQTDSGTLEAVAARKPAFWVLERIQACDRVNSTDTNGSPVLLLDDAEEHWTRTKPWTWNEDVLGVTTDDDPGRLDRFAAAVAAVEDDSCALVLPEEAGRTLSHSEMRAGDGCLELEREDEYLSFLPPTWPCEALVLLEGHPRSGATVSVGSRVGGGLAELAAVQPTALQAPAEWWEAFAGRIRRSAAEPGLFARNAVRHITDGDTGGGFLTGVARSSIRRRMGVSRLREARALGPVDPSASAVAAGLQIPFGPPLERPIGLITAADGGRSPAPADSPSLEEVT